MLKRLNQAWGILGIALLFYACGPTENPLTPAELLQQQIAELDASKYISFIAVVEEGGVPVSGISVALTTVKYDTTGSNDSSSSTTELQTITAVTDAQGQAAFSNVSPGGHILKVSGEGYYSTRAIADFQFQEGYNYEVVENVLVPIPVTETAILPAFSKELSAEAENTATIKGVAQIETDLTNDKAEVLGNITVQADLSDYTVILSDGLTIQEYTVIAGQGFGSTTTDANGAYQIVVPATEQASRITLRFPNVEKEQTVIAKFLDYEELGSAQKIQVLTQFGPTVSTSTRIPTYSGVKVTVPEPPVPGKGMGITNLTQVPRPLLQSTTLYPNSGTYFRDNIKFDWSNTGEGYETSPELVITDPTGSGATTNTYISVALSGFEVTQTGTGYTPQTSYNIQLRYTSPSYSYGNSLIYFYVVANDSGEIGQPEIDQAILEIIENGYTYTTAYPRNINYVIDSLYIAFPSTSGDPVLGNVVSEGQVHALQFQNPGSDYTNPTFTFSGGGASQPATMKAELGTRWSFNIDNSGNERPYVTAPSLTWEYLTIDSNPQYETTSWVYNASTSNNGVFPSFVTVENGEVQTADNAIIQTSFYTLEEPNVFVIEPVSRSAEIEAVVNFNGHISSLNVRNTGSGYAEKFNLLIEPLLSDMPGVGGEISLVGGRYVGSEFNWNGQYLIFNSGEEYQTYANQALKYMLPTGTGFSSGGDLTFYIVKGEEIRRNIYYGTGSQQAVVQ